MINFVRGEDYFVYGAECDDKGLIRQSVLGDIYHSQIVEVGAPSANTLYTSTNQEAYFRAKNGYRTWANSLSTRERTLYVGANDGMLHAFDAQTGAERWAFVPPFIAGRLPEMINDNLNGIGGTEKGGTNAIVEYFGEGTESISTTGKATITNMGAEIGATCSIFPFDSKGEEYLIATGRSDIAKLAKNNMHLLTADQDVIEDPKSYFDQVIEIDLSTLEPHINGPFSPDKAWPISEFSDAIEAINNNDYKIAKRMVDDKKVTDHHAIIPTDKTPNLGELPTDHKNIYLMVIRR